MIAVWEERYLRTGERKFACYVPKLFHGLVKTTLCGPGSSSLPTENQLVKGRAGTHELSLRPAQIAQLMVAGIPICHIMYMEVLLSLIHI